MDALVRFVRIRWSRLREERVRRITRMDVCRLRCAYILDGVDENGRLWGMSDERNGTRNG